VDVGRAHVHVLVERFPGRVGALLRERDRVLHLGQDVLVDGVEVGLREPLLLHEPAAEEQDRIRLHHRFDFFLGPVLAGVGHGVPAIPVGLGLDQGRPLLLARAVDGLTERAAHGDDVHAVDLAPRHAVGGGALVEVLDGGGAVDRRAHAVAVVLDDVDDGQVPERAHVQRFVERALVDGAVPEEAEADLVRPAQPDPVAHARGQREVSAHDAVPAEVAGGHVVEVHRPALAAADPRELAAQLGEEQARIRAPGQRITVIAVVGDQVVVRAHLADGAHADGLLADVEVEEPADLALDVELGTALLEAAYEEHLPVQRQRLISIHLPLFRSSVVQALIPLGPGSVNALPYVRLGRSGIPHCAGGSSRWAGRPWAARMTPSGPTASERPAPSGVAV
jgi:hypothetical protein